MSKPNEDWETDIICLLSWRRSSRKHIGLTKKEERAILEFAMARIEIDQERCKGCGLCIEFCPKKIIRFSSSLNKRGVNPAEFTSEDLCTGCAFCAIMCPDAAIEVWR